MKLFFSYVRSKPGAIALFFALCAIFALVSFLGWVPVQTGLYVLLLCFAAGAAALIAGFFRFSARHKAVTGLIPLTDASGLPPAATLIEADYQDVIEELVRRHGAEISAADERYSGLSDYFTMWAHQIKTPISAMRLLMQEGDASPELREELFYIEQYVDMVLQYIRTDSESTDYVFSKVRLDDIIRPAVKKYASQFIRKKISLVYEPVEAEIITDGKWLSFVLEQIIGNALKYTPSGSVSITYDCGVLTVRDTGIGIAPEDLPRIFENTFTGYNGRSDRKSTGIGLYLCRKICAKLGHGISAESEPYMGTAIHIDLSQNNAVFE